MAYRKKIRNVRKDKRIFSKTADRIHRKNTKPAPMRGGTRL